jgi:hypothetical protein
MQTLSPSIDRIGAALKALRQTHGHDAQSADTISLGAKCLHVIVAQLTEEGVPQEDLQPLIDLEANLRQLMVQTKGEGVRNRRKRLPPPEKGGDARGWRRLLEWRNEISQGFGSQEAQLEYRDFTREIDAIPANERVKRVLDDQLWDRRRKP